jgi:hypothetical protein
MKSLKVSDRLKKTTSVIRKSKKKRSNKTFSIQEPLQNQIQALLLGRANIMESHLWWEIRLKVLKKNKVNCQMVDLDSNHKGLLLITLGI